MTPTQKKFIYGALKHNSKALTRILQILECDNSVDKIGLVKEVHLNTKARKKLEIVEAVKAGKNVIFGMIGAVAIFILYAVIQALINKFVKQ